MRLDEARKRLPIVDQLPKGKTRKFMTGEGAPRPALAVWELTLACDHRCLHCGPRAGEARPDELSTDEALRLVDDLAEAGVGEVVLIGGEAYLRNDFLLIIRRIRERGMTCNMTTGGLGLTRTRAEAMAEAGIESVSVSIDGLEANHDRLRDRPGSWKRAFEALANLRAAGIQIACNSQINRVNFGDHEPLLELLADAGVHSWQLQITVAHGNAASNAEIIIQPYMYLELFEQLDRIADRAFERRVRIWPANNLGYFGPLEAKSRRHQKSAHYRGCSAGRTSIGIESNGMLKNCPSLGGPANVAGSWREHGFNKIWQGAPEMTHMRRRTLDELWGYCRECYYAETCMSGCTAANEPLLGRPGNNPFCHHRALEMDRMGMRERIEPVALPGGKPFDNGLFRLIREHKDPELRARHGPVEITEPRISRLVEEMGPGRPIDLDELVDGVVPF
ncbi:Antilisterial bacteriocin subtilosin biosynthesis protein AlbA [Enhygromyxa salina]|uniref:Antilisterial bacteriocin subtilosin biosynthesis protein AlbA n=1 Tax=Enhygromyxa salina TaxID=215803 RepID=A0A2S9XSM8_9BACT|nr:radical SAM protein [Enhygromyxa salina]PRP95874.1 Antilisterial bacteriocin subtilosin biosynthesis protein AlbA [Enhygromyxa salina]